MREHRASPAGVAALRLNAMPVKRGHLESRRILLFSI
jgi:hypothetical protein